MGVTLGTLPEATVPGLLGQEVKLTINGKPYTVSDDVPADTTLNGFIREHAHLKGTKFMCLEGGCGACIVSVTSKHPATGNSVVQAVNSCLVPIFACHGWAVTTVEGLGNKKTGYDKVVKRLAAANGTQCGYCSPGMVMNMYSLLQTNPDITMKEVENSFGGNICRCTGYRPILDAFKSLASDAPKHLVSKLEDIEDLICPKNGHPCSNGVSCSNSCGRAPPPLAGSLRFQLDDGASWYRPLTRQEVFEVFDMIGDKTYRCIAGNTGHGVYRIETPPEVYIDLNGLAELHGYEVSPEGITLGSNINLTEAMDLFYRLAKEQPTKFSYCQTLADHIDLIANVPVRNTGTFAGNISMKHENEEFPSDIFLILEMVGAEMLIADVTGIELKMGLLEYLQTDMTKKLIVKIFLPTFDNQHYVTRSYKIMPRAQNAHAFVNAGFRVKVDKKNGFQIMEKPTIVIGGINPTFLHATKTEEYLTGKKLMDDGTLQGAVSTMEAELAPDHTPPDPSPEFRKGLALSLLYKFILSLNTCKMAPKFRSGASLLERPVSTAKQDFQTDSKLWPLNKPVPKIEALTQCAGEAEYTNDIPAIPGQVWGQLVLSEKGNAVVAKIDPSEALGMPGVIAFFSAKDIPGKNSFLASALNGFEEEAIFVDGRARYAGEAVGVIIAESHTLAIRAAKKVKITYGDEQKVVIDMRKIIKEKDKERIKEQGKMTAKTKGTDIKHTVRGQLDLKAQYHYTMETQSCVAVPTEDYLEVYPSTQWPSAVQEAISVALDIPEHKLDLRVRRLGGGYGSKISRNNHISVVTCLAAHLLDRPVRIVNSMETNMGWMGKRFPVYCDYEVGVDDKGEIQYLNGSIYQDNGHCGNDSAVGETIHCTKNIYDPERWTITGYGVTTDAPSNTWCRAPGSTEGIAFIENVMEHIANVTGKDPVSVRLANMSKDDQTTPTLIEDLKKASDYNKRVSDVEQFNKANRWKKRGITLVPMNYPFGFWGKFYGMVSIYGLDGTVAITHGAIEMGQGVNTKAAQVAAYILGVDLELISVKPTVSITSPNNSTTGGSIGSEAVCYAIKMCCEELNERLAPIKEKLGSKASWTDICRAAYNQDMNLNHTYMFSKRDKVENYAIYGVTVTEVEVDILTGQYHTRRVDLLEDAGQSLSPEVDIGQVEGAFIMGLGYYTCEEIVYHSETGQLLTNRTWNYKPPGAKDIPIDFRISLRKNAPNPTGVLRSKASGEPPLCMSCSIVFAIRNALESARQDAGKMEEMWFDLDLPFTGERIWLGALTKKEMFKLYDKN